jgi:hypothetical protein
VFSYTSCLNFKKLKLIYIMLFIYIMFGTINPELMKTWTCQTRVTRDVKKNWTCHCQNFKLCFVTCKMRMEDNVDLRRCALHVEFVLMVFVTIMFDRIWTCKHVACTLWTLWCYATCCGLYVVMYMWYALVRQPRTLVMCIGLSTMVLLIWHYICYTLYSNYRNILKSIL